MSNKPINLIIANEVHEIAAKIESLPSPIGTIIQKPDVEKTICDGVLRNILCAIAHQANMHHVVAALISIGVDANSETVRQRIRAARDVIKSEGAPTS